MTGAEAVKQIEAGGIIAIIRLPVAADLLPAAEALREGGLTAIEFALTSPGALSALERARTALGRGAILGAGSVLTKDQAKDAIRAGIDAGVPLVPGAFTATEIVHAWGLGASLVKVFPVSTVGPQYVKDLRGPLPHIRLVPTGGVSLQNAAAFIQAGAAAVGVGGELVPQETLGRHAFREITTRAREFVSTVQLARERAQRPAPPIMPTEGPDTR